MPDWQFVDQNQVPGFWRDICDRSDATTFFHTKIWADLLSRTFPHWKVEPVALEFASGNGVVVPLMRRRGFIYDYRESMLPGVYGGPIFKCSPTPDETSILWSVLDKYSSITVCGNPFSTETAFPAENRRALHTHVLDLTEGASQVTKGFRKGHHANISAARRQGVQIEVAENLADVNAYFDVYQNSLHRWGQRATGFYPQRLFHNLFQLPEYGREVKLWLARHSNRVVAGGWIFYCGRHAVYWHGALHAEHMSHHPVHLMLAEAIAAAAADGFRWFDFNPSGGFTGVEHFKRGFGAEQRAFFSYRRLAATTKAFRLKQYLQQRVLRTCSV